MDRFDFVCFHFVEIGKVFLDGSSTIKKSAFLIGSFAMISSLHDMQEVQSIVCV